jgi:hypothetical protein
MIFILKIDENHMVASCIYGADGNFTGETERNTKRRKPEQHP